MRLRIIFIISVLFLSADTFAKLHGQAHIDSLLKVLPTCREDTNKVKVLHNISYAYHTVDPAEGIKHGLHGLALAESLEWDKGIAIMKNALGANYFNKADYEKALACWTGALNMEEKLNNKNRIAKNLGNIGNVYLVQGDLSRALDYYFKALKIEEETSNKSGIGANLGRIGTVYLDQKNYLKALEYFQKAIILEEELGNRSAIAGNNSNIAIVYVNQKNYIKALEYNFKALEIHTQLGETIGIARVLGNIANIYFYQANYPMSLKFHFKALRMGEELGDKYLLAQDLGNIGQCYLAIAKDTTGIIKEDSLIQGSKSANLSKALFYFNKCIALSKEIGDLGSIQLHNLGLSEAQTLSGNHREAFESYKQYVSAKDSVYNTENNIKITNLETKRDLELKDKQIEINKLAVAKKRNERYVFIAGIVVLLFIIIAIFRNYYRQKQTNSLLSVEKQKSEDLLLNILPAEVADELKAKGIADARLFDNVTVMFTDFVNFTGAGERMSPQQLVDELHSCFKAFDEITGRHNIEKIKTVGDAYIAVSGLPLTNPNHATDVVAAAIEIRNFMEKRKMALGDATFGIRIGIHSGSAVAGIVGVKKFAYDIWGDTVNTAARMEQDSEPGKINISDATYSLLKDKYTCTHRGKIEVKNKGEIDMYFVVA